MQFNQSVFFSIRCLFSNVYQRFLSQEKIISTAIIALEPEQTALVDLFYITIIFCGKTVAIATLLLSISMQCGHMTLA